MNLNCMKRFTWNTNIILTDIGDTLKQTKITKIVINWMFYPMYVIQTQYSYNQENMCCVSRFAQIHF